MKNALNNQMGMLGDMFLWLVANLKPGVIYFIKQALPPNISAGSVQDLRSKLPVFGVLRVHEKGTFMPSSSVFYWTDVAHHLWSIMQTSLVPYKNFELFPILGAIFKQYKVTSQQMDTYSSLIKAPKLEIIKKKPKNVEIIFRKYLYSRYIQTLFSIFFCIFT